MIHGLAVSESGMITKQKQFEVIANNLANATTTGFKRDLAFAELSLAKTNGEDDTPLLDLVTDFSQGSIRETGRKLDFALNGRGFFSIQTQQGIMYTRNGNFGIDSDGYLVTSDGGIVMGQNGPITVSGNMFVNQAGEIFDNDVLVNKFQIVDFKNYNALRKHENSYFHAQDAVPIQATKECLVLQKSLESANVNAIREMVSMLELYRQFEADQKAIKTQDDTLNKAVNDVGQVN